MRLSKYTVFLKIVELGSLSKTASWCNYSQSAVSQMVKSLEQELGVRLLNRSSKGVWLTSEGQQLLPDIRALANASTVLDEHAASLAGAITGLVRVGTFTSVSTQVLAPLLGAFRREYPGIRFELPQGDYMQVDQWVAEGSVDIAFVDLPAPPEFEEIKLFENEVVALLPEGHRLAEEPAVPLRALEEEPVILLRNISHSTERELRKQKITPRIEFVCEDDYTVMAMVENGLGISFLSDIVLRRSDYRMAVRSFDPPIKRSIGLAFRNPDRMSVATRVFLNYVVAHVSEVL